MCLTLNDWRSYGCEPRVGGRVGVDDLSDRGGISLKVLHSEKRFLKTAATRYVAEREERGRRDRVTIDHEAIYVRRRQLYNCERPPTRFRTLWNQYVPQYAEWNSSGKFW